MNTTTGAQPSVKTRQGLSAIWLVPLLALLLGAWMAFDYWRQQGIHISVSFETAEGLEAGKTQVKHRDVPIGIITKISFNKTRDRIVADISIDKSMGDFIHSDTQFWVVKPRVGKSGVSGIGTLLSGAYIELSPGKEETYQDTFVGLEYPPVAPTGEPGLHLTLSSQGGGTLNIGDPIMYRGFSVGEVESFEFDTTLRKAVYKIFIRKPYDTLVTHNTFFWNAGGLTVKTSAEGVKVSLASLETLVTGGIQFDVPNDLDRGMPVTEPREFTLYDSEDDIYEKREYESKRYILLAQDSVGGLYAGAPVQFRGIRVGTVVKPYLNRAEVLKLNGEPLKNRIAVMIRIEPERIYGKAQDFTMAHFEQEFETMLKQGLVGTIQSANPVLGSLLVDLDMKGEPVDIIEQFGEYTVIPSTPNSFDSILAKIDTVLGQVEELPIKQTLVQINEAVHSADTVLKSVNRAIGGIESAMEGADTETLSKRINSSMAQLESTLEGLTPDSALYQETQQAITSMQRVLSEFQPLLDNLTQQTQTLFFNPPKPADEEPTAKQP